MSKLSKVERTGQNRLIDIGNLSSAADHVLCKECVSEDIVSDRDKTVDIIAAHLHKKNKKQYQSKEAFLTEFTALLKKNAHRRSNNILKSSKIITTDKTLGLGSQTSFVCARGHKHTLSP